VGAKKDTLLLKKKKEKDHRSRIAGRREKGKLPPSCQERKGEEREKSRKRNFCTFIV